ncbi:MAG TPA: hypothetical protein ENN84_05970 [Candidatus Marinimicrobia bacterium]|nr:hypothetical protein [Candidatus Neomarinimicrobiota bacterium]
MYCPLCRKEYGKKFTECSDCGVPLVDSLKELEVIPEEFTDDNLSFLPVLELQKATDIKQAKAILDSRLIPYYVQEKHQTKSKNACPTIFWIEKFYIEQAKTGLKKFKRYLLDYSGRGTLP